MKNGNRSDVPTDNFLNPAYAGISAIVGASSYFAEAEELNLTVVHNPLANNPLPRGFFGKDATEWIPSKINDNEFEISPIPRE